MKIAMLYPQLLIVLCTATVFSSHRMRERSAGEIISLNSTKEGIFTFPVEVGTPLQTFLVVPFSLTAYLWLPSVECDTSFCESRTKFNCSASSTCRDVQGEFFIENMFSNEFFGSEVTDTVKAGSMSYESVSISAIILDSETKDFPKDRHPEDGFLGLSPASDESATCIQSPLVKKLLKDCKEKVLGFHFSRPEGSLAVCTLQESVFSPPIHYVGTVGEQWVVNSLRVKLGDVVFCESHCYVYIDSANPRSNVPSDLYNELESRVMDESQGDICYIPKDLLLVFEFPTFSLTFRELLEKNKDGSCTPKVFPNKKSSNSDMTFTLGTGLLRQYYTVLSLGELQQVGFADLKVH